MTDINHLRAENERLKTSGIAEVAAHNPSVMDWIHHWEGRTLKAEAEIKRLTAERDRQYDQNAEQITRIAALEAENEKLRAALREYVCNCPKGTCEYFPCGEFARAALEEGRT